MSTLRIAALTSLAMLAFAGNSILCRIALKETGIDAASFTSIRLASGAAVLWVITLFLGRDGLGSGNWWSALALFTYAAGFSFAYISLTAATGALMLFGAVQVTMIGYGLWAGERLQKQQLFGFALAFGGLIGLLLPGLSAPPLVGSALMLIAGMAWGAYSIRGSIRGKGASDATRVTAGNFLRASLLAALLSALMFSDFKADSAGVGYAVASGAITSGLGYAVWYSVVPALKAANSATVQLSVPVIAAVGGIALLGESITLRFALATLAILGGIALVILSKPRSEGKDRRD